MKTLRCVLQACWLNRPVQKFDFQIWTNLVSKQLNLLQKWSKTILIDISLLKSMSVSGI